ncbi:MAG TPA: carboxypeptidase M32 [Anaerolineae bacterium]
MTAYEQFTRHFAEINDLCCVINLLTWDARTQMPAGGAATRGQQLATVTRLAQERFAGDLTGQILEAAEAEVAGESDDGYRRRSVRQARAAYDLARRVPVELLAAIAELKVTAQAAWQEARQTREFTRFAPHLARMIDLNRSLAEAIGYDEHPYDALLQRYEPGMTAARLESLFAALREGIRPLVERCISASAEVRADFLARDYPEEQQRAFALSVAESFGYDLSRGRLDRSAHPFEISFTREDVRITTRYNRRFAPAALFGTFHESGHALYEQAVDPALTRGPLTTDLADLYAVGGASYGTHESQSRLWENLVGRSRSFWQRHFPTLRSYFPAQLADVDAEAWYRAVNRVRRSPIRVEADEVTYNFHIMLRVEIEMALLAEQMEVADLPEFWRAKTREYLGIEPEDDASGVLQDIHWSTGLVGSFPTYTVGNVMAAQFFEAAHSDLTGLDPALAAGDYSPLRGWLTEHVYRHGRAFSPDELLRRATGRALDPGPYLRYLHGKYDDLFPPGV